MSAPDCQKPRGSWGSCLQALASGWILTGDLCPSCTQAFMTALDSVGEPLDWCSAYVERAGTREGVSTP